MSIESHLLKRNLTGTALNPQEQEAAPAIGDAVEIPYERVVEVQVEVPVERIVEKVVEVPFTVDRVVEISIEKVIEKIIEVERRVEVPVEGAPGQI